MTTSTLRFRRAILAALALSLAFSTAGCETLDKMNPFGEKEKKLPGSRTAVFPEGVPGVDYGAAPPQPANSTYYDPEPTPPAPDAGQGAAQ